MDNAAATAVSATIPAITTGGLIIGFPPALIVISGNLSLAHGAIYRRVCDGPYTDPIVDYRVRFDLFTQVRSFRDNHPSTRGHDISRELDRYQTATQKGFTFLLSCTNRDIAQQRSDPS